MVSLNSQPLRTLLQQSAIKEVFPNSQLRLGFNYLISLINQEQAFYSSG
jgi:hypothetical protein